MQKELSLLRLHVQDPVFRASHPASRSRHEFQKHRAIESSQMFMNVELKGMINSPDARNMLILDFVFSFFEPQEGAFVNISRSDHLFPHLLYI
jgi:hypothetical protein